MTYAPDAAPMTLFPTATPATEGETRPGVLTFFVAGEPIPQGSKSATMRGGRPVIFEANKKTRPWRQAITGVAVEAIAAHAGFVPYEDPVELWVRFTMRRPQAHYRTGQYAGTLRDSAPAWAGKKPDADKLARALLDGITAAGAWRDDSLVASLTVQKVYGAELGARVAIHPLPHRF